MKTYAIVGAGSRGMHMYAIPIAEQFSDVARIVGIYDTNRQRAELVKDKAGGNFPVYASFQDMMEQAKPAELPRSASQCSSISRLP